MATLMTEDDRDFSNQYNTELTPEEEKAFKKWAKKNGREKDVYDYDLRGAWKEMMSGQMSESDNGHLGDRYKKPNHPTFSDESKYSTDENRGGHWDKDSSGRTRFTPSDANLKNMSEGELRRYFKEVEPDVLLNIEDEFSRKARRIYGGMK